MIDLCISCHCNGVGRESAAHPISADRSPSNREPLPNAYVRDERYFLGPFGRSCLSCRRCPPRACPDSSIYFPCFSEGLRYSFLSHAETKGIFGCPPVAEGRIRRHQYSIASRLAYRNDGRSLCGPWPVGNRSDRSHSKAAKRLVQPSGT